MKSRFLGVKDKKYISIHYSPYYFLSGAITDMTDVTMQGQSCADPGNSVKGVSFVCFFFVLFL